MRDIPAQLNSIRKTTVGDIIISFRVDELYNDSVQELFLKKVGTEFIMKLEDVTTGTVIGGQTENDDTKSRFFRQLHAKMRELGERGGVDEEQMRIGLFTKLRKRGIDVQSTKELDIKGLAVAISIVAKMLEE